MTLWRFGRADVAELGVVELARSNELAGLLNRSGDAAEVRDSSNVVQAVENLADSDFTGAANLGRAEVASGQRSLEAHLQDHGLNNLVDVRDIHDFLKVPGGAPATRVNLLGERGADVLNHLRGEIRPEEIGQEEPRQIHQLIGVGVTVVVGHSGRSHPHYLSSHVRQEACFCVVEARVETDVGKQLQAENVLDLHLLCGAAGPGIHMCGEPCEGGLLCADLDCLLNTLCHEGIEGAIGLWAGDELADFLVLGDAKGAEENPERNVRLHAGHGGAQQMNLGILGVIHDFHRVGLWHLVIVGTDGLHLDDLHLLCRIAVVAEHHRAIGGHALL